MADVRINALSTTATSAASDDYLALDGSANGTRKILATNIAQNVTDVTFGSGGPSAKSSIAARAARQGLVFSGTAGGTIANAATIGTADFTIAVWMNLRSTAGSQFILTNSIGTSNFQTSVTDLVMYRSTGSTIATSTSPLVANKTQLIVYTRSGTTGQFYVNGVAFEGTKTDANSYTTFSDIGGVGSSSPCNGTLIPFVYNRALSAAEVVSLYEAGVPSGADYNSASNTSIITGANSDFSSDTGYWAKGNGATISGGKCNLTGGVNSNISRAGLCTNGKKWRVTFTISTGDATGLYISDSGITALITGITGTGTKTYEFTGGPSGGFQIVSPNGTAVIDDLTLYPIGLLLAPDAAQAGGGLTWYDTSGNAANITLPASGVTWNVPTSGKMATSLTIGGTGVGLTLAPSSGAASMTLNGPAAGSAVNFALTGTNKYTAEYVNGSDFFAIGRSGVAYDLVLRNGNALLGTTTDGGQKLQVSGTGYISGNTRVGDATGTKLLEIAGSNSVSGAGAALALVAGSTYFGYIGRASYITSGSRNTNDVGYLADTGLGHYFYTNGGTLALTLDSSQNATFAGSATIGTLSPGNNTAAHFLTGYAANQSWPARISAIYDASYVDTYVTLNGTLTGTRATPTFTGATTGGSYLRFNGANSEFVLGTYVGGAGAAAVPALTLKAGDATFAGNVYAGTSTSFKLSAAVASGANRDVFAAVISGASNGFTIKWNHATSTTRLNVANIPTSSTGLASGDIYSNSGVLTIVP